MCNLRVDGRVVTTISTVAKCAIVRRENTTVGSEGPGDEQR